MFLTPGLSAGSQGVKDGCVFSGQLPGPQGRLTQGSSLDPYPQSPATPPPPDQSSRQGPCALQHLAMWQSLLKPLKAMGIQLCGPEELSKALLPQLHTGRSCPSRTQGNHSLLSTSWDRWGAWEDGQESRLSTCLVPPCIPSTFSV